MSQVGRRSILHTSILHEGVPHGTLPSRNPDHRQELADQTFVGMRNTLQMAVRYVRFAPYAVIDAAVCIGRDIGIAFSIACPGASCGAVSTGRVHHRLMPVQGRQHQRRQQDRRQQDGRYVPPQLHNRQQIYVFFRYYKTPTHANTNK